MRFILFCQLFLLVSVTSSANEWPEDYTVLRDLKRDSYFTSGNDLQLLPYLPGIQKDIRKIHIIFDARPYKDSKLWMRLPGETGVFSNDQIIYTALNQNTTLLWSIDSLSTFSNNDTIRITLYQKKGLYHYTAGIIRKGAQFTPITDITISDSRSVTFSKDYFLVMIVILFCFYAFLLARYPKTFGDFIAISGIFRFRSRDESFNQTRFLYGSTISFLMVHSAMLAALVLIYDTYGPDQYELYLADDKNIIVRWLLLTVVIYGLIVIKYLLIYHVGHLFNMEKSVKMYFSDFIRLSIVFYLLVFFGLSVFVIGHEYVMPEAINYLINIVLSFYIIRFVIIFFRLRNVTGFNILHLFSYLCVTEILPVLVGTRYFMVHV
jgi:hypothetical protein